MKKVLIELTEDDIESLRIILDNFLALSKNPHQIKKAFSLQEKIISVDKDNLKEQFTVDEIKVLKKLAQERLIFENIFLKDMCGKKIEYKYRNKFETWEDAYHNLKTLGFGHLEIIKRIGEKKWN